MLVAATHKGSNLSSPYHCASRSAPRVRQQPTYGLGYSSGSVVLALQIGSHIIWHADDELHGHTTTLPATELSPAPTRRRTPSGTTVRKGRPAKCLARRLTKAQNHSPHAPGNSRGTPHLCPDRREPSLRRLPQAGVRDPCVVIFTWPGGLAPVPRLVCYRSVARRLPCCFNSTTHSVVTTTLWVVDQCHSVWPSRRGSCGLGRRG